MCVNSINIPIQRKPIEREGGGELAKSPYYMDLIYHSLLSNPTGLLLPFVSCFTTSTCHYSFYHSAGLANIINFNPIDYYHHHVWFFSPKLT